MVSAASSARFVLPRPFTLTPVISLLLLAGITTGCGSSAPAQPKFSGNTSVTVLVSSTANDQVTQFNLQLATLTLTSQSGKTVNLLSSQQPSESVHLNGGIEPLTTVSIPQDIYTSATATLGQAVFVCIAQIPGGGLGISNYSIIDQPPTVNMASPITITGNTMTLLLDMQVSSSAVFSTCWTTPPFQGYSMSPTFNLAPFALASSPTNSGNGKVTSLKAQVASASGTGSDLTLTIAGGSYGTRTLSMTSNSATVFQGVSGVSALSPGMFVDVDGAIQADASLLATRIEVTDPSAVNESSGPLMFVDTLIPVLELYGRTELGALINDGQGHNGIYQQFPYMDFTNAQFGVSGAFTNLHSLPFVASFSASTMVAGQNVDISSGVYSITGGVYSTANTITLAPQTINGTVTASQQVGNFTDYTVTLASYDLFPNLAMQPGQTTLLNNPNQVEVYVDNNTQKLNKQALAAGSTLRFYGLVFNDNGTLRMDCAQVQDGVDPQAKTSLASPVTKDARSTVEKGPGETQQVISTFAQPR